ncbi:MAG: bifunctional demethylmenaquinone methyltransferase/2-methoxy-6-polyprenyl-1,4-benzoquinol methylase UbiE [Candidatus Tectomicrobia bacterium]|nr:bifunctional demethylmenaquinone methyltransferase/2-methoxy-6-polyprenyl-1,4-benzoquinol methylase UbiE [Candidatus Tectomicrobia bacterium]
MTENDRQIRQMFSSIAPWYDFLNRLLSFGRDRCWRRFAVSQVSKVGLKRVLDVATGTADMALEICQQYPEGVDVVGIDSSDRMLEIATGKIRQKQLEFRIRLLFGDGQALPFKENQFDAVIIAFGLRNFSNREAGLQEMARVVKGGGKVVILEFTRPAHPLFQRLYYFYFRKVLPQIGGLISGNRSAYQYLPDSVLHFPDEKGLTRMMEKSGLTEVGYSHLTIGIVAVHVGVKPIKVMSDE